MGSSDAGGRTIERDGHAVTVTNGDKVYFPGNGATKGDLVDFYVAVEAPLMAAVGGRPALMQRFPNGVKGKSFFQKRVPAGAPLPHSAGRHCRKLQVGTEVSTLVYGMPESGR